MLVVLDAVALALLGSSMCVLIYYTRNDMPRLVLSTIAVAAVFTMAGAADHAMFERQTAPITVLIHAALALTVIVRVWQLHRRPPQ